MKAIIEVDENNKVIPTLNSSDNYLRVYAKTVRGKNLICSTEFYKRNPVSRLYDASMYVVSVSDDDESISLSSGHTAVKLKDLPSIIDGQANTFVMLGNVDLFVKAAGMGLISEFIVSTNSASADTTDEVLPIASLLGKDIELRVISGDTKIVSYNL